MPENRTLLTVLFATLQESEYIQLTLIDSADRNNVVILYCKSVQEVYEKIGPYQETHCCYFGVGIRGKRGPTKECAKRFTALFAETDQDDYNGDKVAAGLAITRCLIPPSFVVDSGHGWHGYWMLENSVPAAQVEELLGSMKEETGGDAVGDSARVLRVPGTYNRKKPDGVLPCTLAEDRSDLVYNIDDIQRAVKLPKTLKRSIITGTAPSGAKDKSRSGADWSVISALKREGLSDAFIRILFAEHEIGSKFREAGAGDRYLRHTLEQAEKRLQAAAKKDEYFVELGDAYYAQTKTGSTVEVSTFTFDPKRLLHSAEEDSFIGDIHSDGKVWEGIVLPKSAFSRVDALLRKLPVAEWQWLGNDRDVRFLLPYVVRKWHDSGSSQATATGCLGRHGEHWVSTECTISKDGVLALYEAPIVFHETGREHPKVLYRETDDPAIQSKLENLANWLPQINKPECIWPMIGWFFAAPLKPVFSEFQVRFPHLELYGTRGSGKTSTLLKVFLRLSSCDDPRSHDCKTTAFVLLALLSSTNAIPISMSEFRQSTLTDRDYAHIKRALLLTYDTGHDARGRPDQTTRDYPLTAPIVLDGEDVIVDAAIQERTIFINLSPGTIAEGTEAYDVFPELVELPLEQIASRYIIFTLGWNAPRLEKLWLSAYAEILATFPFPIADRIRRNLATIWTGIKLYQLYLQSEGVTCAAVQPTILQQTLELVHQTGLGRGELAVDGFILDMLNEVALSKTSKSFIYHYTSKDNIMWFSLHSAISWWHKEKRYRGESVLDASAIKAQLKERTVRLGEPGQYICLPKSIRVPRESVYVMWGVDIAQAHASGLEVPEKLFTRTVSVELGGLYDD